MRYSQTALASGLTLLFGLAGCSGKVHYPAFYILNVPQPLSIAANSSSKPIVGSVGVQEFTAAAYLKGGYIVYKPSAEEVGFYNYDRWAEDPRQVVTKAFVQEVQMRGIFDSVQMYNGHESPQYLLTGTLDHLEEIDRGSKVSIQVSVSARLIDFRTNQILWSETATKTGVLEQRSVPGVVAEMSRQLGSAVSTLVSSLQDHLPATVTASNR